MGGSGACRRGLPGGCPEVPEDELLMMLKKYLFGLCGPSGKSEPSFPFSIVVQKLKNRNLAAAGEGERSVGWWERQVDRRIPEEEVCRGLFCHAKE